MSKRGGVYIAEKKALLWEAQHLELYSRNAGRICQIVTLSPLGLFALAGSDNIDLVDIEQRRIVWAFKTEKMGPKSLQCTYSSYPTSKAETEGLKSLTICYAAAETGDCVMQAYVPANDSEVIYIPRLEQNTEGPIGWGESMKELRKQIKNPGTWQVLSDGSVVGIRQVTLHEGPVDMPRNGLRQRRIMERRNQRAFANWEVWVTSPCGKPNMEECRDLLDRDDMSNHLVVSELGPKVTVGLRSVAFAFGNVIKLVITGGIERYDAESEDKNHESMMNPASRRRKAGPGFRAKVPS